MLSTLKFYSPIQSGGPGAESTHSFELAKPLTSICEANQCISGILRQQQLPTDFKISLEKEGIRTEIFSLGQVKKKMSDVDCLSYSESDQGLVINFAPHGSKGQTIATHIKPTDKLVISVCK